MGVYMVIDGFLGGWFRASGLCWGNWVIIVFGFSSTLLGFANSYIYIVISGLTFGISVRAEGLESEIPKCHRRC